MSERCTGTGLGTAKKQWRKVDGQVITEGWCKYCHQWLVMDEYMVWPDGVKYRLPLHPPLNNLPRRL